jgi:hypothetical protein
VLFVVAPTAAGTPSSDGYPDSIAVVGHSGATGYDSDPRQPRTDIYANSWATGTNPAVNSVYLRILAKNPRIKGHNVNLAEDGATTLELLEQARHAVKLKPKPGLLLIQIGDNDIICPATKTYLSGFRRALARSLRVLARGAPKSRMFVVSQFGSPTTYVKALTRLQRLAIAGEGPCDFVGPSARVVPKKLARLERTIHAYEAQLAAACAEFRSCRYDGGAFGRVVDKRAYISEDTNHLTIRGHAKAAAVAWTALKRVGLIPR